MTGVAASARPSGGRSTATVPCRSTIPMADTTTAGLIPAHRSASWSCTSGMGATTATGTIVMTGVTSGTGMIGIADTTGRTATTGMTATTATIATTTDRLTR